MKKHSVIIAIGVLLTLLLSGIVYAAASGSIQLQGSVVRNPWLNLDIDHAVVQDIRAGESIDIDDKRVSFSVVLVHPGDFRVISFRLANTGNIAARLHDPVAHNPVPSSGVRVTWPNLNNTVLTPGNASDTFSIIVEWDSEAYGATSGNVVFDALIQYTQA